MTDLHRYLPHGSDTNNPSRIIVHAMGEWILYGDEPMFAANFLDEIGLSAHALIGSQGEVIICRRDTEGAYHAKGHNTDTLGVEFLVPGKHDYASFVEAIKEPWVSDAQLEAGVSLIRRWKQRWDIKTVVRHSDVDPERKVDPGDGFPWERLLELT